MSEFLLAEWTMLRSKQEAHSEQIRKREVYVIGAYLAYYGGIFVNQDKLCFNQSSCLVLLIPIILPVLLRLFYDAHERRIEEICDHIKIIEFELYGGDADRLGWEHRLGRQNGTSKYRGSFEEYDGFLFLMLFFAPVCAVAFFCGFSLMLLCYFCLALLAWLLFSRNSTFLKRNPSRES